MMAGVRWNVVRGIDLTGGGGPGLSIGYGTPSYRLFLAFSVTPALLPGRRPLPIQIRPVHAQELPPLQRSEMQIDRRGLAMLVERTLEEPRQELAKLEDDRVDLLAPVLFARDKDLLLIQSRAVLDAAVAVLQKHAELELVRIEGHTDGHGKPAYNLSLSRRRAKAVVTYLVKHGIGRERLESEGFGSARPLAKDDTAEGRARNRRVEMIVVRRDSPATASAAQQGPE